MAFENLIDNIKSSAVNIAQTIQNSTAFANAQDKFEALDSKKQKIVLRVAGALLLFLILFIPTSIYLSSRSNLNDFEENRTITRDLLRVVREKEGLTTSSSALNFQLLSKAEKAVSSLNLLPEQKKNVKKLVKKIALKQKLPKAVNQQSVEISLSTLNLRQIVQLGKELEKMDTHSKILNLSITENLKQKNYFDVKYTLAHFSIEKPKEAPKSSRSSKFKKKGSKK